MQVVPLHVAVRAARRALSRGARRDAARRCCRRSASTTSTRARTTRTSTRACTARRVPLSLRADVATPLARRHAARSGSTAAGTRHTLRHGQHAAADPTDPSPDMVIHRNADAVGRRCRRVDRAVVVRRQRQHRAPARRCAAITSGCRDQWTLDPRLVAARAAAARRHADPVVGRYHEPPLITDLDPIFGDRVMLGSSATQVAIGAQGDRRRRQGALGDRVLPGSPRSCRSTRSPARRRSRRTAARSPAVCSASAASSSTRSSARTAIARRSARATRTASS